MVKVTLPVARRVGKALWLDAAAQKCTPLPFSASTWWSGGGGAAGGGTSCSLQLLWRAGFDGVGPFLLERNVREFFQSNGRCIVIVAKHGTEANDRQLHHL